MRRFFEAFIKFLREADMLLLVISVICTTGGIVLISSVIRGSGEGGLSVQIGAFVVGVMLYIIFSYIDIDTIADKSTLLLIFSVLFISTLFIWGVGGERGNTAWLRFYGIGVQPAEVVKITFIIITARIITNHKERKSLNTPFAILQILSVFTLLFGLIIISSADLGSALVYLFILVVMLFIGGLQLRWFAAGGALLAIISPIVWSFLLSERQKLRILAVFRPQAADPGGLVEALWQTNNSKLAIASGGFLGQGLYNGRLTQARMIPEQRTDFIFSAAGEELGFVGCLVIILLLMLVIIRCVYVGVKSNNSLGLLVCTGIAAMLIAQTVVNIGMCIGLMPVVGLTLPFFSSGGSSVVTIFSAMGIISGIKMRPKPVRFRNM